MEVFDNIFAINHRCSSFFLGLLLLLASALSLADAKSHYHDFVVCLSLPLNFLRRPCLKLFLYVIRYHNYNIFMYCDGPDSSNSSEEAVQDPEFHHGQWDVPRTNTRSE